MEHQEAFEGFTSSVSVFSLPDIPFPISNLGLLPSSKGQCFPHVLSSMLSADIQGMV